MNTTETINRFWRRQLEPGCLSVREEVYRHLNPTHADSESPAGGKEISDLAEEIGVSKSQVSAALRQLGRQGKIREIAIPRGRLVNVRRTTQRVFFRLIEED